MILVRISSHLINIQGREHYLHCLNIFTDLVYLDIYRLISFRLGIMIENTKPYLFILVWMAVTFIQGHGCTQKPKPAVPMFLQISESVWIKVSILPQPVDLLKLM